MNTELHHNQVALHRHYTHNTAHAQGERSAPTAKHLRSPRNAPNLTGTHEEAREQARKELH